MTYDDEQAHLEALSDWGRDRHHRELEERDEWLVPDPDDYYREETTDE